MAPTGAEDGGDELIGLPVKDEHGMVDVLAVKAVIGATFLVAVDRVVRSVDIQNQRTRHTSPLPLADVQPHHCLGHRFTGVTIDGVLQSRQGRLRSQVLATFR